MKEPLISVIMPVYNAARYLPACLDALAAQTWTNFEVIAVVDGSPDHSAAILEDFARTHPRFRVICQENSGVSRARNVGLEAARGQYLAFCDADDLPAPDYLETLYRALTESGADWSACGFSRFSGGTGPVYRPAQGTCALQGPDQYSPLLLDSGCGGYLWNKLLRRDLVETAPALRMGEELYILEDLVFILSYARRSHCLALTDGACYGYRIHQESALQQSYNTRRLTAISGREGALELLADSPKALQAKAWNDLMEEYAISYQKLLRSRIPEKDIWRRRVLAGFRQHRGQFPLDSRWNLKLRAYYALLAAAAFLKK